MALYICIDGSPAEGKHRHLSGLQVLLLAIELVGDEESQRRGWEGKDIAVGSSNGLTIKGDEVAVSVSCILMGGVLLVGIGDKGGFFVESLHVVLLLPDLRAESSPSFQHQHSLVQQMYFIKTLLSPRSQSRQQSNATQILTNTRVLGEGKLHPDYMKILNRTLAKVGDEQKCLKMVIGRLQSLNSIEELVKLFTLIHHLMVQRKYQGPISECIQSADIIVDRKFELQKQYQSWFIPFYRNYLHYLTKIAFNADIFVRVDLEVPPLSQEACLNDFFRILNQMNTFLSHLNNTLKTVGRYYRQKFKVFQDFYNIFHSELVKVYQYLRHLVNALIKDSQKMSIAQLQAFIVSVPEYELMIDNLQQVLMCKYFEGSCKLSQPYIFAEDIAKLNYLVQQKNSKSLRISESIKSIYG